MNRVPVSNCGEERTEGLGLRQVEGIGSRLGDNDLITKREINRVRVVRAILSRLRRPATVVLALVELRVGSSRDVEARHWKESCRPRT